MSAVPPAPDFPFPLLPAYVTDQLPEPRRSLHRAAVAAIERFVNDGMPFVLMLRTYHVTQMFGQGDLLETIVHREIQASGVGVIEVQADYPDGPGQLRYRSVEGAAMSTTAPSLFSADENWLAAVTYLIRHAEMVVVTLSVATPGVILELDTIADLGRTDRSVVVVTGANPQLNINSSVAFSEDLLINGGQEPDFSAVPFLPALRRFCRVCWSEDLPDSATLDGAAFRGLIDRAKAIAALDLPTRRAFIAAARLDIEFPVDLSGLSEEFHRLALERRRVNRAEVATLYFGNCVRLALVAGDALRAIDNAIDQARLVELMISPAQAQALLASVDTELAIVLKAAWQAEPDLVRAHARLVAEQARVLTHEGHAQKALRLLQAETTRCEEPYNPAALSILACMKAWSLRAGTDVDAVFVAAKQALDFAEEAGAAWETGRALAVLGATLHDVKEFKSAATALLGALQAIPERGHSLDHWSIFLRLADVFADVDQPVQARIMLSSAMRVAAEGDLGAWQEFAEARLTAFDAGLYQVDGEWPLSMGSDKAVPPTQAIRG